jgi:ATP-dependent RNA helicase RhlE
MTSFKDLQLNNKILTALENKGYSTPTPIQLQAIPHVIAKKDILGIAQTGTGKTAAFSLPILHNLFNSNIPVRSGGVRALILTPTRELASQIAENIEAYSKGLSLRHAVIYGGVNDKAQIAALQPGVDILIATPGRLMDLMNQGYIRLMNLEIFVLDEADRMLDMGFIDDIKKIVMRVPAKRQTLFFSATMPSSITNLANSILNDPVKIEVTPQSTTVDRIDQKINFVEKVNKLKLLKHILKQEDATSVLVFCRTKHGADDIAEYLERARIPSGVIHGNKDQSEREKSLTDLRDGKISVLVATDVAARGIDIPAISHVINFDIPSDPESYVHRIGRTARAGREGVAISFCDPKDDTLLVAVEKAINFKIPVDDSHPFSGKSAAKSSEKNSTKASPSRSKNNDSRKPVNKRNSGESNAESKKLDSKQNSNKKPQNRKNNKSKEKKKSGILSFLVGLFTGGNKTVNKESSSSENRKEKPQSQQRKPQRNSNNSRNKTANKGRTNSENEERREKTSKPRPSRPTTSKPSRQDGERRPRPTGPTRKISSGRDNNPPKPS